MKRAISWLAWIFVVLTMIALICTIITTYSYSYIKYFDSYYILQWSIFFTMILWAIKLFGINKGRKKIAYSLICCMFALGAIFFWFIQVK